MIPWDTRLKSRGKPISAQELKESSKDTTSTKEESGFPGFYWRGRPIYHKHLKNTLPSAIGMWEGPWVCCLKKSGYRDALTWKKVIFPCNGLNAGFSFIEQDEAVYESPVENLEKALGARLIWTGSSHLLKLREAWRVQCFKRWRGLTLLENWWESQYHCAN